MRHMQDLRADIQLMNEIISEKMEESPGSNRHLRDVFHAYLVDHKDKYWDYLIKHITTPVDEKYFKKEK